MSGMIKYFERADMVKLDDSMCELRTDMVMPRSPRAYAVLGPSWLTEGMRVKAWANRLAKDDVASIVVHFPGHGVSEGPLGVINLDQQVEALHRGRDILLSTQSNGSRSVAYGGSSGGYTAALHAAAHDPAACAVFGISPFHSLQAYRPFQNPAVQKAAELCSAYSQKVDLSSLDGRTNCTIPLDVAGSLSHLYRINLDLIAPNISVPLLIGFGKDDDVVDSGYVHRFLELVDTPRDDVHAHGFDGAGHTLEGLDAHVEDLISGFVRRYL
ncbi:hypothetical protein GF342_04380 [Candidatus Woesearchaeota archaeon]|nr:hypothetical protein [Candidatus Woesearchaeota archaeon]